MQVALRSDALYLVPLARYPEERLVAVATATSGLGDETRTRQELGRLLLDEIERAGLNAA